MLQVRKYALLLASLLPNKTLLTDRLGDTLSYIASFNKDCKDQSKVKTNNELSIQICFDILKQLKPTDDSFEISLAYLRVVALYMEHLVKIGSLCNLEQQCIGISTDLDIKSVSHRKKILEILVYLYRLAARIKVLSTNRGDSISVGEEIDSTLEGNTGKVVSHKKDTSSHGLNGTSFKTKNSQQGKFKRDKCTSKEENGNFISELSPISDSGQFERFVSDISQEEESLIFMGFQFVCSFIGWKSRDLTCFSLEIIDILLPCTAHGLLITKSVLASIQKGGSHGKLAQEKLASGRKVVVKPETETSVYQTLLMISFKNLLLTYHLLQSGNSKLAFIPATS